MAVSEDGPVEIRAIDPRLSHEGIKEKKLGLVKDSKDLRTKPQKRGANGAPLRTRPSSCCHVAARRLGLQGQCEVHMAKVRRMNRRMAGLLRARLPDPGLEKVADPRRRRGRRWKLATLLRTCLAAMVAGCRSLGETESLTEEMSTALRAELGIARRVPDTSLRGVLVRIRPSQLRNCLRRQTRRAYRRKALAPVGLPFGVVAIDGKSTSIEAWDRLYAQRHEDSNKGVRGLVRTLTCSLVSSRAKVCIDAVPIPPATNEMGHFCEAFRGLLRAYGRSLFRLVSTDAGMCSLENAGVVKDSGKEYLFCIKGDQPTLLAEAKRLLEHEEAPLCETVDVSGKHTVTRRLYRTQEMAGYLDWSHLRTVLRVESSKREIETGFEVEHENRYFISSLDGKELTDGQWLYVVRQHWAVENQCHNTWDTAFEEDGRPWIVCDPQGTLVVALLRRLAYNMLALFRSVSQRSEQRRQVPWKELMRWMYNALIGARQDDLVGLRARQGAAARS